MKTHGKAQFNGEKLEAGEYFNKATEVRRWAACEGLKEGTSEQTVRIIDANTVTKTR